jgi:UDP-N-acetylmuramoyl-L-alanyl-D-glutamate--2,6-diaminopimelate ligase
MSALKKAARKVISKKALRHVEKYYRLGKVKTATALHGYPAKKMRVIAVTGTNGKTTTCAFVNEILKAGGYKTAVYTTAFIEVDGHSKPNQTHMTLANAWVVQKFFAKAKRAGVDWVVLEVTSHALDQYRILGIPIEIAIVTNISQDHLDYHGTMENYASAKARLITEFNPKVTILNADDKWFEFFAKSVKEGLLTVGCSNATHQIKGVKLTASGTEYKLVSAKGVLNLKTELIGEFNVYNSAFAAAAGQVLKIESSHIKQGIANVLHIPGRMEAIEAGQPFIVVVDFAVTPEALEKALQSLKGVTKGDVRLVFGATGDRDKLKRPIMGQVAAKLADNIYLTDDETYTEDGDIIRASVKEGIAQAGGLNKCQEIADRYEAIKTAFTEAKTGDVVILAGIGSEDYRNQGGKKIPWDEREIARKILKEIGF